MYLALQVGCVAASSNLLPSYMYVVRPMSPHQGPDDIINYSYYLIQLLCISTQELCRAFKSSPVSALRDSASRKTQRERALLTWEGQHNDTSRNSAPLKV